MGSQRHDVFRFTPGKDSVPTVQKAGWAPGPVWTRAENFVTTGIRFPDRPARSNSLYRYPGSNLIRVRHKSVKMVEFEVEDIKCYVKSMLIAGMAQMSLSEHAYSWYGTNVTLRACL